MYNMSLQCMKYAWHHGGWTMTSLVGLSLEFGAAVFSFLDRLYINRIKSA